MPNSRQYWGLKKPYSTLQYAFSYFLLQTEHWKHPDFTLHTAHCILDTLNYVLPSVCWKLHSANCTLKTAHCKLHTDNYTLTTAHWKLKTVHCLQHHAFYSQHTERDGTVCLSDFLAISLQQEIETRPISWYYRELANCNPDLLWRKVGLFWMEGSF